MLASWNFVPEVEDPVHELAGAVLELGQHVHGISNIRRQSPGGEGGVGNSVHEIGELVRVMADHVHELSHRVKTVGGPDMEPGVAPLRWAIKT